MSLHNLLTLCLGERDALALAREQSATGHHGHNTART